MIRYSNVLWTFALVFGVKIWYDIYSVIHYNARLRLYTSFVHECTAFIGTVSEKGLLPLTHQNAKKD